MASKAVIVQELMDEAGKSSPALRRQLATDVGEITVDLLTQNNGQFKALEKTQELTVLTTTRKYKLNADFNTAKETIYEVDDDGEPVAEITVLSKSAIYRRRKEGVSTGYMGWVARLLDHADGPGFYLILSYDPPKDTTYEFDYYRVPTANDTDIIRKSVAIKSGVRGKHPEHFATANAEVIIYERIKQGFKENTQRFQNKFVMTPNRRTGSHNKLMVKIAGGG